MEGRSSIGTVTLTIWSEWYEHLNFFKKKKYGNMLVKKIWTRIKQQEHIQNKLNEKKEQKRQPNVTHHDLFSDKQKIYLVHVFFSSTSTSPPRPLSSHHSALVDTLFSNLSYPLNSSLVLNQSAAYEKIYDSTTAQVFHSSTLRVCLAWQSAINFIHLSFTKSYKTLRWFQSRQRQSKIVYCKKSSSLSSSPHAIKTRWFKRKWKKRNSEIKTGINLFLNCSKLHNFLLSRYFSRGLVSFTLPSVCRRLSPLST